MDTKPKNEMLNMVSERAARRLSDEFVSQCVERHKQEQAQKRQRDVEASNAEMDRNAVAKS